ncbi:MAG: hypothetical protein AB1451_02725 [Nitrospirota bacterium]
MTLYDVNLPISEDLPIWPGDPGIPMSWVTRGAGARSLFRRALAETAGVGCAPPGTWRIAESG